MIPEQYIEAKDDRLQRPMIAVNIDSPTSTTTNDVWFVLHDLLDMEILCQTKLDIFEKDIEGWDVNGLEQFFQVCPSSRVYEVLKNHKDINHKNRMNKHTYEPREHSDYQQSFSVCVRFAGMKRIQVYEFEVTWTPTSKIKEPYKVNHKIRGRKELIFSHDIDNFMVTPRELGDGIKISVDTKDGPIAYEIVQSHNEQFEFKNFMTSQRYRKLGTDVLMVESRYNDSTINLQKELTNYECMILLNNMISLTINSIPYDGMLEDNFGIFDKLEILGGFSLSEYVLDNPQVLQSEIH